MELDVINKTAEKGLEMVILKLLFLSYMPGTLYFSVLTCKQYSNVLHSAIIQEQALIYKYGFDSFKIF